MVLRIITEVNEKHELNKDSTEHKDTSKLELLYDIFYNKYGITKLTDKKFKEVLVTIIKNRSKVSEIAQFAHELGLQF